ncbi:hypothetical protein [Neorhizobium sp. NCHU2750]|uniref:hypothetical protein n=1 Tax=Neorhizobium sp. NCHU2750 TaxID=1825976 RepID=UPI000EB77B3E|nr:hypothetical protein NCHU2750_59120 [Neorhizobium sp. NCHU2750]
MIETRAKYATPGQVRAALTSLMPPLADFWSRSLRDYAAFAYQPVPFRPASAARSFAKDRLRDAVTRAALRAGHGHQEARSAGRELYESPVVQTGPHCLMLYEPDAFYTHLFSLMGLQAYGRNWHIAYAGSTMSFNEAAKKGPGWLRVGGEPLNVFGLPRSRMDGSSICCSNGPLRFSLTNAAGQIAPNAAAARLVGQLPSSSFQTAAEAIKTANGKLWNGGMSSIAKLLLLDDFDLADLIADHLDHSGSWLTTAVFSGGGAASIVQTIDGLTSGPWRGWIRRSTDFFWLVGRDRIQPLRLEGGFLRSPNSTSLAIEFTPSSISEALRKHMLLPNLFMSFLVLSILPGIRALGGCRQTVYLPLMRYLVAIAIARSGDQSLLDDLWNDDRPSLWGHRVLRPTKGDPFLEMERAGAVEHLLALYADMPLIEASGDLVAFTGDPIWEGTYRSLFSGLTGPACSQWAWSGFAR